ncbi:hypothetical protein NKR23_g12238 [Pleurostoma richardsiae]|uniref:Uncharacterized protein n=1 Tax=Pleurostoma richardsiae TaxID=41990 RepID=A0AA38R0F8_9PEZI|nr:hypothetical protein NKR23_g12238 [Pleurostoma richardsiae]
MSNYTIRTGVWLNYDYSSPVVGATLTVPIRWGNYLIAALSSLVAWAGTRAWSILSLYIHQRLAARQGHDALHQQLQILFRGGGSVFDAMIDSLDLQRAWHGRAKRVKRRTLSLTALSALFFLAFAAAGVFVAEVATKSYQDVLVLATQSDCGDFYLNAPDQEAYNFRGGRDVDPAFMNTIATYQNEQMVQARDYARSAYSGAHPKDASFVQSTLPFSSGEVPCPWSINTTCLGPNMTQGPAWQMDSGLLDSHVHFGMNSSPKDRVKFRKLVTCGVVDTTNLTTDTYTLTQEFLGREVNSSYIGVIVAYSEDYPNGLISFEINANQVFSRTGFNAQRSFWRADIPDERVREEILLGPPFNAADGDVTTWVVTQGSMFYYFPADDPLFLAHEAVFGETSSSQNPDLPVYYPTNAFGMVVCKDQMQFCNPVNGRCTGMNGIWGLGNDIYRYNNLDYNDVQRVTAMRMFETINLVGQFGTSGAFGPSGLTVAELNSYNVAWVPATQWISEVQLWFETNLASLQYSLLEWAVKPWPTGHPEVLYPNVNMSYLNTAYRLLNLTASFDYLCQNQLIRSTAAVQNFSVLALVLVIVFSVTIIAISAALPACLRSVRERHLKKGRDLSGAAEAGRVARLADQKYQMLAIVLENAGVGTWERSKADIPVTVEPVAVCKPFEKGGLARYPSAPCIVCRTNTDGGMPMPEARQKSALIVQTEEAMEDPRGIVAQRMETSSTIPSRAESETSETTGPTLAASGDDLGLSRETLDEVDTAAEPVSTRIERSAPRTGAAEEPRH